MMMKSLFALLMILSITICKAQNPVNQLNSNKKIKKMNSSDLDKLLKSDIPGYILIDHGSAGTSEITDGGDAYQEIIRMVNSPYATSDTYFKTSLNLKSKVQTFYDNPIGTYKEYDDQGNIIDQINCESSYPFSFDNLIQKLTNEYNINLLTPISGESVTRDIDDSDNVAKYFITYPTVGNSYRLLIIDGTTGALISDTTGSFVE
jgi:hypothetical protein